ncbi:hypothetical protein FOA52_009882 [Chlamydomonas sp. UWO 241]|nr:hypothetical protein FOA52_009882 [Chlamydomonas sp. UWO 241]
MTRSELSSSPATPPACSTRCATRCRRSSKTFWSSSRCLGGRCPRGRRSHSCAPSTWTATESASPRCCS